jgi:CheY-like chemotaxis protein
MSDAREILIVEDSPEGVLFLSEILEAHGYRYRVASNGREAMSAIQEKPPDLVLLDIMMPRRTGLGVLKDMKRDPKLEKIPVIVVTGASAVTGVDIRTGQEKPKTSYDDDFARSYGAKLHDVLQELPPPDGFVEKPIDPPVLVKMIGDLLG